VTGTEQSRENRCEDCQRQGHQQNPRTRRPSAAPDEAEVGPRSLSQYLDPHGRSIDQTGLKRSRKATVGSLPRTLAPGARPRSVYPGTPLSRSFNAQGAAPRRRAGSCRPAFTKPARSVTVIPNVLADFDVRDAPFGDDPADEPG